MLVESSEVLHHKGLSRPDGGLVWEEVFKGGLLGNIKQVFTFRHRLDKIQVVLCKKAHFDTLPLVVFLAIFRLLLVELDRASRAEREALTLVEARIFVD